MPLAYSILVKIIRIEVLFNGDDLGEMNLVEVYAGISGMCQIVCSAEAINFDLHLLRIQ